MKAFGRFKIIKASGACVVLVIVTGLELSCQRCGFLRRMDILLLPGGCHVVSVVLPASRNVLLVA